MYKNSNFAMSSGLLASLLVGATAATPAAETPTSTADLLRSILKQSRLTDCPSANLCLKWQRTAETGQTALQGVVAFDAESGALDADTVAALNDAARSVSTDMPGASIRIDRLVTEQTPTEEAASRAATVRDIFVANGVDPGHVTLKLSMEAQLSADVAEGTYRAEIQVIR